jgi:ribosomal protein S18 acetylase RimI-like enzyme
MAAITRTAGASTPNQLRPFDVRHDLNAVADLVELCFAKTLDADGRRYIHQMRSAARSHSYLLWAAAMAERVSLPLTGFVWEENGYLAGNLSLIPFNTFGRRIFLIANVAVDPAYRRRGIARALTNTALEYVQKRGVDSVWLHVREENVAALELYRSLGFEERTRRTTWVSTPGEPQSIAFQANQELNSVRITRRHSHFWSKQRIWLDRVYPVEIAWHMSFNLKMLHPGLLGALLRLISGTRIRQWAALRKGKLLGVLAWQPLYAHSDHLWLATAPEHEDTAIRALLLHLQRNLSYRRELSVEYSAEHGLQAFEDAWFKIHQTLIWMEKKLKE